MFRMDKEGKLHKVDRIEAGRDADKDLAICEAATPGPWELEPEADDDEGLVIWRKDEEHPGRSEGVIVLNPECHYEEADVTFISEAREALATLDTSIVCGRGRVKAPEEPDWQCGWFINSMGFQFRRCQFFGGRVPGSAENHPAVI